MLEKEQIGYINAHGTSTPMNDKCETLAVKQAFGEHAYNLAISSTKSMTGHLLGASGGIEAIITIAALKEGFLPPTIGYKVPDMDCDLDIVANKGRTANIEYACPIPSALAAIMLRLFSGGTKNDAEFRTDKRDNPS